MPLGRRLRDLRRQHGLTQVQQAQKAHLSQAYIAKLETQVKANPSLAILQRLAKALGVPVSELVDR